MKTNEKDTKQWVVPTLRFPEFHGSKGWDLKPLSDYLTEYRQKSDGRSKVHSVSLSKGIVNQIEYLGRSFSADDTSHYKLVKPYDVVYTKSPTGDFPYGIVKQNFNPYNVIVSPLYGVFTPDNQYIGYIIHSIFESAIRLNNYLSTLIQKGAKNTIQISNDTFISKEILLPDNEDEQQKIADCLSSIDTLIKATENKIDELKAHKKGLMQQLFPAEGKTVPQYRFPEFRNSNEWVYLKGDVVFKQISNKNHNSDLPILAISQEHGAVPRDLIDYKVIVSESGLENYKVVEVGDFIISLRSFQGGIEYSNYKGICSPAYGILRKRLDVENQFFKYYFKSHVFIRDLNKNLEGIRDGKMVSYKQFSEILLPIPSISDKREQQKIADCLSSVDNLITTQTNRLEALKAHKKGLMQQLFPNINDTEA